MKVKITLEDEYEGGFFIENSEGDESKVLITIIGPDDIELQSKVSMEDLKHALRKISCK